MMARHIAVDYAEIQKYAAGLIGKRATECIEAYARKRRIIEYKAGNAFWSKVFGEAIQLR